MCKNKTGSLLKLFGCFVYFLFATDIEVVGGQIWALGPDSTVTKVSSSGTVLNGQQFDLSNDLNVTDFEVFNNMIWGVRGDNQLLRYDLSGNYLGGSGLWGNATDIEVVGGQIWALGPDATVTKVSSSGTVLNGQQFDLSNNLNVTDFEVFNNMIWGVRGDNQLLRYDLSGNYLGGSGLWGNATSIEVVPIPASMLLFGSGLIGLLVAGSKRRFIK